MAVATTFGESGDAEAAIRVRVRWLMCNETPRFVGVTTEVSFRGSERCAVAHCGCAIFVWAFLCDTPVLWLNSFAMFAGSSGSGGHGFAGLRTNTIGLSASATVCRSRLDMSRWWISDGVHACRTRGLPSPGQ